MIKLFKKWQSQIHIVNILPLIMLKTLNNSTAISAKAWYSSETDSSDYKYAMLVRHLRFRHELIWIHISLKYLSPRVGEWQWDINLNAKQHCLFFFSYFFPNLLLTITSWQITLFKKNKRVPCTPFAKKLRQLPDFFKKRERRGWKSLACGELEELCYDRSQYREYSGDIGGTESQISRNKVPRLCHSHSRYFA